jgi:hypothetical protein
MTPEPGKNQLLKDHIVICNWNEKAPLLIDDLHSSENLQRRTIVIIADNVDRFPSVNGYDFFEDTVLIPGDPTETTSLKRASVDDAHTVIILPKLTEDNPDDQTIQVALVIKQHLETTKKAMGSNWTGPRVVAKVIEPSNATHYRRSKAIGIHEVVCESELGLRILSQTSISPGVSGVLTEIITYDQSGSELYSVVVPKNWVDSSENKFTKFQDIVLKALDHQKEVFARSKKEPGSDIDIQMDGLKRNVLVVGYIRTIGERVIVMVNPSQSRLQDQLKNQLSYMEGDKLLVLSDNLELAQACLESY